MIFPKMVTEHHCQVVERQLQVVERRSGPFRLNLTTGLLITDNAVTFTREPHWSEENIYSRFKNQSRSCGNRYTVQ